MTLEALYRIYKEYPSVQTDTRKLKKGDLFFALKGTHFNGNRFAAEAAEAGAAAVIIDEPAYAIEGKTILVPDVLDSLQQLAKFHRQQFSIPVLAITGSNGKTTTKELIHATLSSAFRTSTTEGNLNNHIGIPLTLLKIPAGTEIAVIEMGANHIGEIASYCRYTLPTHGLITNCGKAHLEGFGSIEGVRKGKGELYDFLRDSGGTIFRMEDYDYLREMSKGIEQVITYGTGHAQTEGQVLSSEPFLDVNFTRGSLSGAVHTRLVGDYNLPNILAAAAVGGYFHVPADKIRNALEQYSPSNSRSQMLELDTNKIILDAYNANPSSMKAAIDNFARMQAAHKTVIIGGMAELGPESLAEHEALVKQLQQFSWEHVLLVGGDFKNIQHPYSFVADADEARNWFSRQNLQHSHILVKGSRSIQLEKILNA